MMARRHARGNTRTPTLPFPDDEPVVPDPVPASPPVAVEPAEFSDEHPETEREARSVAWREWVLDRVEFPRVVEVPSNARRPPTVAGSTMSATLAALYELSLGRRGVTVGWDDLGDEAGVSRDQAKRAAIALELLGAIRVHRRAGKSRPHTFEPCWAAIRRHVRESRFDDEPDEFQPMHVQGLAGAQPGHQRMHQPPRGEIPTSSRKHAPAVHACVDWLGHVREGDLRNPAWLHATYERAVAAGLFEAGDASRAFVDTAASRALGGAKPGGLFRRIIETEKPKADAKPRTRYAAANHPSLAADGAGG